MAKNISKVGVCTILLYLASCGFTDNDDSSHNEQSLDDSQVGEINRLSATEQALYGIGDGCYAIKSPGTGKFLKKKNVLGAGLLYKFENTSASGAEHFYVKAADLGSFLLTATDGKYLSSLVPFTETPTSSPSVASEWKLSTQQVGNSYHYKFQNSLTNSTIQLEYLQRVEYFGGWIVLWEPRIETHFELVPSNDCRTYPEVQVNVAGNRNNLKGNVSDPVRGVIDAHTHITSYEFMGGNVMHGDPFHRWGAPYALSDSKSSHGINGSLDLIGNIFVFGDPLYQYDTRGWPDFPWWPNHVQLTHSGYYYKWIERAWLGGLRMTVTSLVENEVLCNLQSTINPIGWVGNDCNTMASIRLQVIRMRQMQDYIDAQYGGPGKGFFRIVTSPQQARQVIAEGKLAVVMGVEVSEVLNCGEKDDCDINKIETGLMELYGLGIRSLFPSHKFDNKLAGAVLEDGFINIGEALSTGHYYETKECDEHTKGKRMTSGFPLIGEIPPITDIIGQIGFTPDYPDSDSQCNIRGLTPLGAYLVNRMIDLKMIIEIDHQSSDTTTQIMDIVEARNYSGVVSSHSFLHQNKQGGLHNNTIRMLELGGFLTPYNGDADSLQGKFDPVLDVLEDTPYLNAVGIGTDMSGLGGQPGPRGSAGSAPLNYPFTSEFGLQFQRNTSGNRTFDLNVDGIAHYGMLADHFEDVRQRSSHRVYEALMNSAEGYLQMWERAEANNVAGHISLEDITGQPAAATVEPAPAEEEPDKGKKKKKKKKKKK